MEGKPHHLCASETSGDFDCALPVSARLNVAHNKSDNPLNDPKVKELNKRLAHCAADVVSTLKRCRRTLKNRGYAKNCRIKRIAGFKQMQQMMEQKDREIASKNQEIEELQRRLKSLQSMSYFAPPPQAIATKVIVDSDKPSAYVRQLHTDCNNNYQQQQWQQQEQLNYRQQQHCFRTLQEAEMSYANLLEQDDPLEQICQLEQQNQMIDEKQQMSGIAMAPATNYVDWAPTLGQL